MLIINLFLIRKFLFFPSRKSNVRKLNEIKLSLSGTHQKQLKLRKLQDIMGIVLFL